MSVLGGSTCQRCTYIGIKIENFEVLLLIKIEKKKQVKNIALLKPLSKTEIEKQYATILQFKITSGTCSFHAANSHVYILYIMC